MRRAGIRTRLTIWYASAVAVVLALYALAALLVARHWLYEALDGQLHEDREVAEHLLRRDPDGRLRLAADDPREAEALGFGLVVQAENGGVLCSAPDPEPPWAAPVAADWRGERTLVTAGESFRVHSSSEFVADQPVVIHVGRSERPLHDDLRGLVITLLLLLPLAVSLSAAGGWFLARRALVPLVAMTERAHSITAEQLGERLPVANPHDELGRLAIVFNATLARLERSFTQLRRFTADASHELRTPLTVLRTVGEVALQREPGAIGDREVIGSMLEEAERMSRLVDTLLLLARSDSGALTRGQQPLDLRELAVQVVATLAILADEKHQSLSVAGAVPVPVRGDPALLRQALVNLVDNALKHTPSGGAITVEVGASRAQPATAECRVRDSAPGIAAEHRARIFERFYRVDEARSRADGGAGLGLALARSVVELHGGSLDLVASDATGSTFRMLLPMDQASA